MKLLTGSFGTLGVLTQLTWRTYPLSEASQTVLLIGNASAIQPVTAAILQSSLTPVKLDVLSAGLLPEAPPAALGLAVQFQSIAAGVAEQVERLQAIAQSHTLHAQHFSAQAETQFWQSIQTALFAATETEWAIAKLGVLPAQVVDVVAALHQVLAPDTWQVRLHASSGIGTLSLSAERNSVKQLQALRSRCQAAGGYLNLLAAPTDWKQSCDPWDIDTSTQKLMSRLKANFDPKGRFSPGRMG